MITTLTKDSTYYNDLRNVYVKYDFKKETFEALNAKYGVNFPTETESDKKSDAWYTQVKNSKGEMVDEIDHYYYITVVDEKTTYNEIATPEAAPEGVSVFPVYKSSPWLFSRYSDDTGGILGSSAATAMTPVARLLPCAHSICLTGKTLSAPFHSSTGFMILVTRFTT